MALSLFDFLRGLDFTALANATAADHNALVDSATPASDTSGEGKGIILWTVDSALNTPRVPDPLTSASYNKWKRYIWVRIPHSTSTSTIPLFYAWNDSATSVATYLKWQRPEADFTSIQAQLDALDLRVDDLEASITSALNTANAANATASLASTNASSALSTANAANANATTALANAATAQTTADSATATANTANTNANSAITTANAASASVAASGPQFIAPVTVYNAAGALPFTTYDVSANVPSGAKAILLEAYQATPEGVTLFAVNVRKDSSSSSYTLIRGGSGSGVAGAAGSNQGMYPCTAARTFQLEVTASIANAVTVRLVGYIL